MKKGNQEYPRTEEGYALRFRERPGQVITITVPSDVIASLERVAETRDMSVQALVKFYIGQSLRQDLSRHFANRALEKTAQVLTRHLASQEEVSQILDEIRAEMPA